MFNNHKLIQIDEHKNWFQKVLNKKNILLIIGFFPNSDEKIGSLRFDKSKLNKYFISINIAIVTISDTRDFNNDKSGETLVKRISNFGHKISVREIVKDDFDAIHNLFLKL